ncbi:hypothetical protein [Paenibacillus hunanensis]|uniref:DUF2552 domain-containing protein n=1 Tax=Paenibacillus hunanensis TaxID=539262 RepID=A0ABU1IYZ6_9BACL|nr:hypothetical protein [Paenibacillus hunanensis]MDR6243443.1 hypothetical protein [Paenibacillus hunanensis]GGI97754.1 hypothetical protein GCM10008022_03070 [Paenibacillus hunanensis]
MQPSKNIRVLFHFGEGDEHEVDLQLIWKSDTGTEASAKPLCSQEALNAAVEHWVAENVSYTWEEILSDDEA